MIATDCLVCRYGPRDRALAIVASLAELARPGVHHHHWVLCEDCDTAWFDDITLSPLGIPRPSRRGTALCRCPDDGAQRYVRNVVVVAVAESACRCGPATLTESRAAA